MFSWTISHICQKKDKLNFIQPIYKQWKHSVNHFSRLLSIHLHIVQLELLPSSDPVATVPVYFRCTTFC